MKNRLNSLLAIGTFLVGFGSVATAFCYGQREERVQSSSSSQAGTYVSSELSTRSITGDNEEAKSQVQNYQSELSNLLQIYLKKISYCLEAVKSEYTTKFQQVHDKWYSKLQTLIDDYYPKSELSAHLSEALTFFTNGSEELASVYNEAFEANKNAKINETAKDTVVSYQSRLSAKCNTYVGKLSTLEDDYIKYEHTILLQNSHDSWWNKLQSLIDTYFPNKELSNHLTDAQSFFTSGSEELANIYNAAIAAQSGDSTYLHSISISMPDSTDMSYYKNMYLELKNQKSDQCIHYVITESVQYIFANIISNSLWNVVLRNEQGDIFGKIDNVEVKDKDVNVSFATLSKPQSASLIVLTPDGQDVTSKTKITWTDSLGNYLSQGTTLTGLPIGYRTNYHVTLSQELAMVYVTPLSMGYVLNADNNHITCQLSDIPKVQITGKVKDSTTNLPLSGAFISASQTFGGKYNKTVSTKTDANGNYTLTISNVPTSLDVAALDYISQSFVCDTLMTGAENVVVQEVSLNPITGAVVLLGFTYTSSTEADGETDKQNWYGDINNVTYSIYNKTKQQNISQFNVQYSQLVLMEEVEVGDMLELTATSKNTAFMPVVATAMVDSTQRACVTFDIVELGKIRANFSKNDNAAVVGSLYDANGKFLKSYNYSNASLTISNLADGKYTLISMGSSKFYNTIYDLSQLPQTGLVSGLDYVQNTIEVKSGVISVINIDEVPALDESKLYYTGSNTSFTVNKSSIVVGNYLTMTGRLDFRSAYAGNVSNVNLVVDLPESCEFVENSVMVGYSTSSYTLRDNHLIIPMARYTDRVRFCIIPTLGGDYTPSAFVQFDIEGETIIQPIGSAHYIAKDLSISVPETVSKTTIPISGTAIGASDIEIYDGDVLIGQTRSLSNGVYSTTCELNEPYNLSTHSISAKITTKSGMVLTSETTDVIYNKDNIVAEKVTMLYFNPEMDKEYNIVFDLTNGTVTPSSFYFFPYKSWPNWSNSGTEPKDFTFIVDLSNNDTTVVKDVTIGIYTNQNRWMDLKATYDENIGKWTAMHKFEESNLPIGVKVDFEADFPLIFDENIISDINTQVSQTVQKGIQLINEIDSVSEDEYAPEQYEEKIMSIVGEIFDNSDILTYEEISSWSDIKLDEQLQTLEEADFTLTEIDNEISEIRELFSNDTEYSCNIGEGIKITSCSCSGLNAKDLLELGYEEYVTTEGQIYVLRSDTKNVFVDFSQDLYIEICSTSAINAKAVSKASGLEEGIDRFNQIIENINDCYQRIGEAYTKTEKLLGKFHLKFDNLLSSAKAELPSAKTRYYMKLVKLERLEKELANMTTMDANYYLKQLQVDTYRQEVKAAKSILDKLNAKKAFATMAVKISKRLPVLFEKNIPLAKYGDIIYDGLKNVRTFQKLYLAVPDSCKNEQSNANTCKDLCVAAASFSEGVVLAKAGASALLDFATIDQLLATAATGGVSALTAIGTVIINIGGNIALDTYSDKIIERKQIEISRLIDKLKCEDDKCPKCHKKPCECENTCPVCNHKPCICCIYCNHYPCTCPFCSKCGKRKQFCTCKPCKKCGQIDCICKPEPTVNPIHDPSGFVYEGVFSNRLEGVTATCYYKETVEDMYGDKHENIVKWDAAEYAQENPLFTDEKGFYRWDVPQGLWQVKFEKAGYETTYSEWLPVPPPQLDINIAMKQNVQPNVKVARAYGDAVEVEFDKYMIPELLNTENINVKANGKNVEGTIELLNEEVSFEGVTETFASKVRFNAVKPFDVTEVTVMVYNRVKSYAGTRMQDNYQQVFTIEQEIKQIVCDSLIDVGYGASSTFVVQVLPALASKGKVLTVKTSSPMILGVETEQVLIDNDGMAEIIVSGELPGTAALTFSVEGTDKTSITIAKVQQIGIKTVATPKANIASGSVVDKGTAIELFCETEGATIYYTLDGSCPCENTDSRRIYDGTPIVINEDITIKAMATIPGMYESEIAEFTYIIDVTGVDEITVNDQIQIYPLPVHDKVNISAGGRIIKSAKILSTGGTIVASINKPATIVTFDVGFVAAGVYIINLQTEDNTYSRKILIVQ